MRSHLLLASALARAATTAPALAQTATCGRLLASGCFQCHGTDGLNGAFGTLAGIPQKDMLEKLRDMRTKTASGNIMYPHARGYTDSQLLAIADYFARLPKP